MIYLPVVPVFYEVEYDGHSIYTCFDLRDALDTAQFFYTDKEFLFHFAVDELAICMYFNDSPLVIWVWNVHSDLVFEFDSAKVFKFFDSEEVESYGGTEKS